jgi:hypothetical protein
MMVKVAKQNDDVKTMREASYPEAAKQLWAETPNGRSNIGANVQKTAPAEYRISLGTAF